MRTLVIATAFYVCVAPAWSSTIVVPDNAPTIQAAVDLAASGDTVMVRGGTYSGLGNVGVSFGDKNLAMRSESGAESTFVDCAGVGRALTLAASQGSQTRIEGFTFMNGSTDFGGGIYCTEGCGARISHCSFIDNHASTSGGGLRCEEGSCLVSDCVFEGNSATWSGGGAWVEGDQSVVRCSFIENDSTNGVGGGLVVWKGRGSVEDCSFVGNTAYDGGGLMCTPQSGNVSVSYCSFLSNEAEEGGGMWTSCTWGEVHILNCTFVSNVASDYGGGLYFSDSRGSLTNTIVAFSPSGGAIACSGTWITLGIQNCCLFGNEGGQSPFYCGDDLGNLSVDPLLCDMPSGDLSLCSNSPCLDYPFIGAYGVGCGSCTSPVQGAMSWGGVKALFR